MISLRVGLEEAIEEGQQNGFVFGATGIELERKANLGCSVDDLGPKVYNLRLGELNFQPDQFPGLDFPAGQYKAPIAANVGHGRRLAREHTFPARGKVHSHTWC